MMVYSVPVGQGYNFSIPNGGYGRLAVPFGTLNPYPAHEYPVGFNPNLGTYEGTFEGEDDGWGTCTFTCALGICHV